MIKQPTEVVLSAEFDQHFTGDTQPNRRRKTIKAATGSFEVDIPRDRAGTLEPELVKKDQTKLTDQIDCKILSMFALGMSYRDIRAHVEDMYGLEVSEAVISGVTDQLIPEQQRPLEAIYPIVWLNSATRRFGKAASHWQSCIRAARINIERHQ